MSTGHTLYMQNSAPGENAALCLLILFGLLVFFVVGFFFKPKVFLLPELRYKCSLPTGENEIERSQLCFDTQPICCLISRTEAVQKGLNGLIFYR